MVDKSSGASGQLLQRVGCVEESAHQLRGIGVAEILVAKGAHYPRPWQESEVAPKRGDTRSLPSGRSGPARGRAIALASRSGGVIGARDCCFSSEATAAGDGYFEYGVLDRA
jgi:hypothetical protein